ncbi:MAG TPA: DUF1269 domain-containing protein [Caulobacteraceae bacterium]|nr:DUF1269 domain-containing protein [Caulobacteraceae bacterium]
MSKFVVVVFPDEAKAYEGVRAIKELSAEGSLTVYAGAVIVKDANGTVSVKEKDGKPPFGVVVGAVLGGLIGGPPVAALGAAGAALIGGWRDALDLGVGLDFVDEVSRELAPGKSAILAEVEEDWLTPLDSRMEALGGVIHRARRDDFEDERIRREVEMRRADLAQLEAERAQAQEERKAKLEARVEEARAKCKEALDRAEARMDRLRQETEGKIEALQDQAAEAQADAREKIDQRIAEIRAAKLKQAWELTKEALAP